MREGGKGVGLALFLPVGRKLRRVDIRLDHIPERTEH